MPTWQGTASSAWQTRTTSFVQDSLQSSSIHPLWLPCLTTPAPLQRLANLDRQKGLPLHAPSFTLQSQTLLFPNTVWQQVEAATLCHHAHQPPSSSSLRAWESRKVRQTSAPSP